MKRKILAIGVVVVLIISALAVASVAMKAYAQKWSAKNYMRSIMCVACLMYPDDHNGYLPTNFVCMSNYISNPEVFVCPGDHLHQPVTNWVSFTTNNSSFVIVSPGARAGGSNTVFLLCTTYGYVGYANAAIYDSSGHLLSPAPVILGRPNTALEPTPTAP